jgi:hypothetical protein
METIELEGGWFVRQMEEVQREVSSWPNELKPLLSINDSLIHKPSDERESPTTTPTYRVSETPQKSKID